MGYLSHTNINHQIKDLQDGLIILVNCTDTLKGIMNILSDDEKDNTYIQEIEKLTSILDSRLSYCLQQLIKCSSGNKKRNNMVEQLELFKSVYSLILKQTQNVVETSDTSAKLIQNCDVLL